MQCLPGTVIKHQVLQIYNPCLSTPPQRWHSSTPLVSHLDGGHGKEELAVEAPRTSQGGVDRVDLIGGTDDDDLAAVVKAVHERKERRHDGAVDLVLATRPDGGEAVDLVKEDDGRSHEVGLWATG